MSVDDDEAGPGPVEVARWTPADLPPGLEYLPAEIEQHEMHQLQREYDAGMYRDDLGAYTVQDRVGLPDRSPAYGEAWQATVARLDAAEASERAEIAEQIAADWARTTALSPPPLAGADPAPGHDVRQSKKQLVAILGPVSKCLPGVRAGIGHGGRLARRSRRCQDQ